MTKRILHLTLTKKWFDLTAAGRKPDDFRVIKDYWVRRFFNPEWEMEQGVWREFIEDLRNPHRHNDNVELFRFFGVRVVEFDEIHYKNGYRKNAPFCRAEWGGLGFSDSDFHKPQNGEILNGRQFAVMNRPIIETRNWENPFK